MSDSKAWVDKYLSLLGLSKQVPSSSFLEQICRAHLNTFPFENISKLIYFSNQNEYGYLVPKVDDFLDNYLLYQFGGTCFTLNSNLKNLLTALGFDCYYVSLSGEHMAIVVQLPELGNERVYVDCGAAAPFFRPVRIETESDPEIAFGMEKVLIRARIDQGVYRYERYVDGELKGKPWYFNIDHRYNFEDFSTIIQSASQPGKWFMSTLRCQLWQLESGRSLSLFDNIFTIRYEGGGVTRTLLHSIKDIEQAVAEEFHLPSLPIRRACEILTQLGINIFETHLV